ncbi:MAG: ABC transporter permease [Gammaproteobacteria bacterium]|nr:ABC transporter permease [Gammaproteobacteria bacterium]
MYANYLRSALRSLLRQKLFALINISGLGFGLAACTLIMVFVQHEFSYDNGFADIERLYRIEATANIPGQQSNAIPTFFGPSYDLLPQDFEEIELIARLQQRGGTVIQGDTSTPEAIATADPEFLAIFDFPMLEGNRTTALDEPTSIVLTREMAIKHLGDGPWLGRTMVINETIEREMKVTGVIETLPGNTHFNIDILVPIDRRIYEATASAGNTDLDRWNGLSFNVYIKLKEGRTVDGITSGINDWVDRHFPARIQALVGINGSELFTPRVMPVKDIHMFSPVQFDMQPPGSMSTIYGFGGIALLMLAIACINFVNLSTATSTLRAKEVALRKVMGASRGQLFTQFEIESVLYAFAGLLFALVIIELILPSFSNYTQRDITTDSLRDWVTLSAVMGLTLIVGLSAGIHPALVLSGLRPGRVLQASQAGASGGTRLRAILVLFQFAVSSALITTTLLIYIQTDYARSMNMGYDNENKLTVRGLFRQQIGDNNAETVRDEIARLPGVTEVSLSSFTPGDGRNTGLSLKVPGQDERVIVFYRSVYPEFFTQFEVTPRAGRLLDHSHPSDRTIFISDPNSLESQDLNVVVNEMAAKTLGFSSPEEAIGQIYYRGRENQIVNTIVGVVPNFHFGSPRSDVDGEIFMFIPAEVRNLLISYEPGRFTEVRETIEAKLATLLPRAQTTLQHLRENIARQYQEEEIQSTLLGMFSGLAVLIACMGLFGLASFTILRRTKEIGIRKVMGASSTEIVLLLLRQFSTQVFIANIIAWPFCWYVVREWLNGFNYQIQLLPWFLGVITLAVLVTVALAWSTVAYHAFKVARTNPIFALRYE